MGGARTRADGRLAGLCLLTAANVITAAAAVAADWNNSHVFNDRWPPHARFHGVTALATAVTLSSVNVWALWSGADDDSRTPVVRGRRYRRLLGAVLPGSSRSGYRR